MTAPGRGDAGVPAIRLTALVQGRVQGVSFRWWVRSQALELGLAGWARNLPDGRVEVVAEGARAACRALLDLLTGPEAPGRVTAIRHQWGEPHGDLDGFAEL